MEGPSPEALLAAARELAPRIEAAGDEIERERRLPAWLIEALQDAGLFCMTVPRSLGGSEAPLAALADVIEVIAMADGSTAWCLGQNAGIGRIAGYLPEATSRQIFGAPDCRVAWGPGPMTAVKVDGGYRLTARLSFASGMRHATWLGCNGAPVVDEAGRPLLDAAGQQLRRILLFPASEASVRDIWQVSGLRGTASDAYEIEGLFVSEERCLLPQPWAPGPLYVFASNSVFSVCFSSVALGLARAALDAFLSLAIDKTPRGFNGPLREWAPVQMQVAQAEATWQAARALQRKTVDEVWRHVCETHELPLEQRMRLRLATTYAIQCSAQVVDTAYYCAGASAIFAGNGFERRFRDMHAVTQQVQGRLDHFESVGRYLLGLEPDRQWI